MSTTQDSSIPPPPPPNNRGSPPKKPLTPEQIARIEANRARAKAILEAKAAGKEPPPPLSSVKRPAPDSTDASADPLQTGPSPPTKRPVIPASSRQGGENAEAIKPVRKFAKYVEYDLSKMTDTKAGFMATADDPYSLLTAENLKDKPANMSLKDWAKHQERVRLREQQKGAYEPSISVLDVPDQEKVCFECGSPEIDWQWKEVFRCRVCEPCKKKFPEKYSLLTKTDAREDYMLTEPELKDTEILPHLEQANPHKSTWSNMMLYVRYQVEEQAIRKWGSLEAMDAEYERRVQEKKKRQDKKFTAKLRDLKKRTMVESWKRERNKQSAQGRHEHVWGAAVTNRQTGETVRTCEECGFELEELVF